MDYETFKEKFVEDLKDKLYEQGAEVNVSVHNVNKLNESYEAVTVTPEGSNIGVNIPIDKFYDAIESGKTYDDVVDKAVDVVTNGISQRPDFDIDSLSDYSQMKEKLAMEVVSAEANKEMLETVPHPYVWGGSSPSTSFDCSGFVSYVINNCGNGWNYGRLTANGWKNATARVNASDVKPGDLIFFQGTYDTSGASHVGIVVDPANKIMIHCGNPIQYASYDSNYWRQHFYCYGRIQ